jgi:hypothetical protein
MFQLAYWYGYESIGLVGVDHRYSEPAGKRKYHKPEQDTNHYTPGYFDGLAEKWIAPDISKLNEWHDKHRHIFTATGIRVRNLTPGSALKAYEFMNIEEWVNEN